MMFPAITVGPRRGAFARSQLWGPEVEGWHRLPIPVAGAPAVACCRHMMGDTLISDIPVWQWMPHRAGPKPFFVRSARRSSSYLALHSLPVNPSTRKSPFGPPRAIQP